MRHLRDARRGVRLLQRVRGPGPVQGREIGGGTKLGLRLVREPLRSAVDRRYAGGARQRARSDRAAAGPSMRAGPAHQGEPPRREVRVRRVVQVRRGSERGGG